MILHRRRQFWSQETCNHFLGLLLFQFSPFDQRGKHWSPLDYNFAVGMNRGSKISKYYGPERWHGIYRPRSASTANLLYNLVESSSNDRLSSFPNKDVSMEGSSRLVVLFLGTDLCALHLHKCCKVLCSPSSLTYNGRCSVTQLYLINVWFFQTKLRAVTREKARAGREASLQFLPPQLLCFFLPHRKSKENGKSRFY